MLRSMQMGGSYSAGFFCALNESLVLGQQPNSRSPFFLQAKPIEKECMMLLKKLHEDLFQCVFGEGGCVQ